MPEGELALRASKDFTLWRNCCDVVVTDYNVVVVGSTAAFSSSLS